MYYSKVRFLFKDCKQIAGCSEFRTETGLRSLDSVRNSEHPAICLQSLKRERTLGLMFDHSKPKIGGSSLNTNR